jgi:uncharacterized integral membrane protein
VSSASNHSTGGTLDKPDIALTPRTQVIDMVERERVDAPDTDQIPVQSDVHVPPQAGPGPIPTGQDVTTPAAPGTVAGPGTAPHTIAPSGEPAYRKVRRTRFSGLWVGLTVAAVVLLILLVFIIENSRSVDISFFGAHGHLSLGVALLLAAICGVLLVAVPGYGRILQLRRALRKSGVGKVGRNTTI